MCGPLASSRNGARGVALHVVVGNQEEIRGVLDEFLVLLCSVSQEGPHVQQTMPMTQCGKHTLQLYFGFRIE